MFQVFQIVDSRTPMNGFATVGVELKKDNYNCWVIVEVTNGSINWKRMQHPPQKNAPTPAITRHLNIFGHD